MFTAIIWFELAAFIASILALPVIRHSRHLRIYPLLLFVVAAVEGYYTFVPMSDYSNAPVYNVQIPLQYVCYLAILYHSAAERPFRIFLISATVFCMVFSILTTVYMTPRGQSNLLSYSVCSILAIIGIIWKFYEMIKVPSEPDFLTSPFFYMLFAFLLFNLGSLPYFIMANWFYRPGMDKNIWIMFEHVTTLLNFLLYSTYAICFLWILRKKVTY